MNKTDAENYCFKDHFYGATTIGEHGQVVIPTEARKKYGIEGGDKILIVGAPHEKGLMMIKIVAMHESMHTLLSDLQQLDREAQNDGKSEKKAEERTS